MSEELISHIYEPFVRAEDSVTNKVPGAGLGLAITKKIVEYMEGSIEVKSEEGKGTQFEVTVSFPIDEDTTVSSDCKEEIAGIMEGKGTALKGRRFLCAEDNELNAEILEAVLKIHGAECTIYPDGRKITEAFKTVKSGDYDAILMDVQMPEMNGYEASVAIREGENPLGRSIPIIAMTANALAEDVQKSFEAGMDAHISKPIDIGVLEKTIKKVLAEVNGN